MTAGQLVTPRASHRVGLRDPFRATAIVVTFMLGVGTGLAVPAIVMPGGDSAAEIAAANPGVATNNMSDAVREAHLKAQAWGANPGVATNNMSDAVRNWRLLAGLAPAPCEFRLGPGLALPSGVVEPCTRVSVR